MLDEDGIMMLS